MKSNKSFSKRIRVTPSGKLLARKPGKNHFNAKESRGAQLTGKRPNVIEMKAKDFNRYLSH